jgi:hypothetical protein
MLIPHDDGEKLSHRNPSRTKKFKRLLVTGSSPEFAKHALRVVLDGVIYGTIEDHEPGGITGDNLG